MQGIRIFILAVVFSSKITGTLENQTVDFYGDTSENFILRWTFQKACDFVFDPIVHELQWPTSVNGVSFDPELIKPGNLVFVRNAPLFFQTMHPKIKHPYIMLTMGEFHESVCDTWLNYLNDDKIIAWFSIHACEKKHPKFYPIPIGLFQLKENYHERAQLNTLFKTLRAQPKTKLVYSNYFDRLGKKPDRKELDNLLQNKNWITYGPKQPVPFLDFMKEMAQCKFAFSPKGRGIDCYRTWEALIVGTIPIVKKSQLNVLYEGLPILVLNDWSEISEEFLHKKYEEIVSKKYDISPLFCEYWLHKIDAVRSRYFKEN